MTQLETVERMSEVGTRPTSEERTWAALAHASTFLTLLLALASGGIGGILMVFVPLIIYFAYKDKSDYVAYQAAQAFALQIIVSLGFFAAILFVVALLVFVWVIVGLLSAILVGLLLIPFALILTLALIFALVAAPFVFGGFSLVATVQTANGEDYRYPYVGKWVADWFASQATQTPAV